MGTNYYWYESEDCPHCHRSGERKHIGKSSAGWVFALHVYPDEGITDLSDWIDRFFVSPKIADEYGRTVPVAEMLETILLRGRKDGHPKNFPWAENYATPGPRGLVRADTRRPFGGTIRHGAGTWDCHTGDFS